MDDIRVQKGRSISISSQFQHELTDIKDGEDENEKLKNSLRKLELELRRYEKDSTKEANSLEAVFKEAVGLSKKGQNQESEEGNKEKGLKKLSNLFSGGDRRKESRTECKKVDGLMEMKELSPDMAVFASYLHTKGYFVKANFMPNNKFDVSCFVNSYGRDFLKFAAEEFAKDHRDIYKWLPAADLKKVAQFGCPSLGRKNVFSAKAMRFCYGIREETVCNKCALKESCKFPNQSVWKKGAKNIDLVVVMRVITLYALPSPFEVPEDVMNAVNRLLKEVVRLSEIES
ncbi:hypothetical protein L1987_74116 [Smallanthus sonchifolius]|uniref:Uncharacterized protein n=1 Tax=Smallanthus sonchifolius TaxID=185202 RepID=A0ACB9A2S2_9ASTR|nr:hypothetical protein L1987_74116 [Smallanthus sonchifolius]